MAAVRFVVLTHHLKLMGVRPHFFKKYRKPVKLLFYHADSKAADNLRNVMVSYPGQKKFIFKDGF